MTRDVAAIRAAWHPGEPAVWLLVDAGRSDDELLGSVRAAAGEASAAAPPERPPAVVASELGATSSGVVVFFDHNAEVDAFVDWVERFCGALSRLGVTADVSAVQRRGVPVAYRGMARPCATLAVSLAVDPESVDRQATNGPPYHFHATPEAAESLVEVALDWLAGPADRCGILDHRFLTHVRLDDLTASVRSLPADIENHGGPHQWACRIHDGGSWRTLALDSLGRVIFETGRPGVAWTDLAESLTETMRRLAPVCDYGYVRRSLRPSLRWWEALGRDLPADHRQAVAFVADTRPLDLSHVPAPQGVQLLTDAHLARAEQLGPGWRQEPVADGRHLVRAADLSAWFDHPVPAARTLHEASADFGSMVPTAELYSSVVKARPVPGWVSAMRRGDS